MPNVWGKGALRHGTYKRHSVDRDVKFWVGWTAINTFLNSIQNQKGKQVATVAFKVAGRITEALSLRAENFSVTDDLVIVKNYHILKRWKKKDTIIECGRCKTLNDKFTVECSNCHANLVYGGKKHYVTEKVDAIRLPFFFPMNEPLTEELLEVVDQAKKGLLFPSPYSDGTEPYTRSWAYKLIATKQVGTAVGLDHGYNHLLRAYRMSQLGQEKDQPWKRERFSKAQIKTFTGITKDETVEKYTKEVGTYVENYGIELSPEQLGKIMKE